MATQNSLSVSMQPKMEIASAVFDCRKETEHATLWSFLPLPIFFSLLLAFFFTTMTQLGVKPYYQAKIEECELVINDKTQDLRRLEAQRNALNAKGVLLFLFNLIK